MRIGLIWGDNTSEMGFQNNICRQNIISNRLKTRLRPLLRQRSLTPLFIAGEMVIPLEQDHKNTGKLLVPGKS